MITRTVRIPRELSDQILKYIDREEYSTMADFTLHAIRFTLTTYLDKKSELDELNKHLPGASHKYKEAYEGISQSFLMVFDSYQGENVQINVRIPAGLNAKILNFTKPSYGLKKKADFLKVSIVCLLSHLAEWDRILEETNKSDEEEEELRNLVLTTVSQGLLSGKSMMEIVNETMRKCISEKKAE